MINNNDVNKIKFSDTHAKPIIKVRVNPSNSNSKAAEADLLILQALARLNSKITNLEGLISQLLKKQHYSEIRERERRW
jgi:hypothetical protein